MNNARPFSNINHLMLCLPSMEKQRTNLFNALLLHKHLSNRFEKWCTRIIRKSCTYTLNILTIFICECEYIMCVSKINIAIKCIELST